MTKRIILYISIMLGLNYNSASSQEFKSQEVRLIIDSTFSIMKNNAVNSNTINWAILRENALQKATKLSSPYELGAVMRDLYRSIDDFHGGFFYRDSVFRYNKRESIISDSIINEWKKKSGVKAELLNDKMGYLRVPSMPGGSKSQFDSLAQNLNDKLCYLLSNNIKGIILDLRINGGGAIFPMILGLEQLIKQQHVGSFQTKEESKLILKDYNFYIDTVKLATITPKCFIDASKMPIVILTSNATGSSGEFLIMAFKGRPNIISIGATTSGYITLNEGFQISNDASMNLSVGYAKDRNGKIYTKALKPDILITSPDKFNDLQHDDKILAATKWLKNRK